MPLYSTLVWTFWSGFLKGVFGGKERKVGVEVVEVSSSSPPVRRFIES